MNYKYIFKRLLILIPTLFIVSILIFLMLHLMPGDPAVIIAGQGAEDEDIENVRISMGFDKPLYQQYFVYIEKFFKGDFGVSIKTNRPVITEIISRFPNTLQLASIAMVIAIVFGVLIGLVSATRKYSLFDNFTMFLALVGVSIPIFYLGLMLLLLFGVKLGWLPLGGNDGPIYIILPAITLSLRSLAIIARMTRSSMLEVMSQDYIVNARAQGFSERKVIFGYALKNAMNSVITIAGVQFGYLLGGTVVTEKVFAWPGLGRLLVNSIMARDFPVVQTTVLFIASAFVFVNFAVDILYTVFNPQIKYS